MGAEQSNLSPTPLDFVVAVSMESLNATMFQFLDETDFPTVSLCWTQVEQGPLTPITLQDLMAGSAAQGGTNGTNPFNVPSWNNASPQSPDITNIDNSNFACGIQMQIGIPSGMNIPGAPNPQFSSTLPYVVALDSSNTNTSVFNLLFAQFTVVYPSFGRNGIQSYTNAEQPDGSSWGLQVTVPLNQLTIPSANAPQNVQTALSNLGDGVFSIQQLFLDFTNAILTQMPTQDWPSTVTNEITAGLVQTLISESESSTGLSTIGYTITASDINPSTFSVGNLEMVFDQYQPVSTPTQPLSTFNYLCTVPGGNTIPPNYSGINWNWFDNSNEAAAFDGIVAVNRNTLAAWIVQQMQPYISQNCYTPAVTASYKGGITMEVDYTLQATAGATATVNPYGSGPLVTDITYSSTSTQSAYDTPGTFMGSIRLSPSYNATVVFEGNSIIITQHLVMFFSVDYLGTAGNGNVVDITISDTYTLAVSANGELSVSLSSGTQDNSQTPSASGFLSWFSNINELVADVATWAQNFTSTNFTDIPVSVLNQFVFPGAQTFAFSDVYFSDNFDLITEIVYDDPN